MQTNEPKEVKLLVAGSRSFDNYGLLSDILFKFAEGTDDLISLVSGMARGADALAVRFAKEHNVKLYEFPADWDTHGKRAGYLRNQDMGRFADAALIFWDGYSRGTRHMMEVMDYYHKPYECYNFLTGEFFTGPQVPEYTEEVEQY